MLHLTYNLDNKEFSGGTQHKFHFVILNVRNIFFEWKKAEIRGKIRRTIFNSKQIL